MRLRKIVNKPINYRRDGVNVAGNINGVIAGNVGESGRSTRVSSVSRNRVVQRGGKMTVSSDAEASEDSVPKEVE